jgi:hypothetical protein
VKSEEWWGNEGDKETQSLLVMRNGREFLLTLRTVYLKRVNFSGIVVHVCNINYLEEGVFRGSPGKVSKGTWLQVQVVALDFLLSISVLQLRDSHVWTLPSSSTVQLEMSTGFHGHVAETLTKLSARLGIHWVFPEEDWEFIPTLARQVFLLTLHFELQRFFLKK